MVCKPEIRGNIVAAIDSAAMGSGNDELGRLLMKGFIYALSQQEQLPKTILFYNGGANIPIQGSVSVEDLKAMLSMGNCARGSHESSRNSNECDCSLCKCNETINEFDFDKIIIYNVITARFCNAINYMNRMKINMNALLLNEIKTFGGKPESQKLTDKGFTPGGFEIAIRRATIDVTPRTLSRRSVAKGNLVDALLYGENSFLGEIEKYFSNDPCNEEEYDKWHTDMCRLVLGVIQRFYTQKNGTDVCYGKAQKIVNMTLKGCYCLDGARDKEEYFKHCHMALDSFTLTWYKRHGYKCGSEWSNLSYDEYSEIKTNIREIAPDIDVFEALTPLQIEFLIWPLEIMVATVKEINKCLGGLISADYAESYFEKHKLGFDLKMANIIIGKEVPDKLDADFINWLNQIPENQSNKKIAAEKILSRYE